MFHFRFLEHQDLRINLQKGFWRPPYRCFVPGPE